MAVDPKIIYEAARVLSSEKVRKFLLTAIFFVLGLVMLVGASFSGLISGILGIFVAPDVKVHWSRVRNSLNDVMESAETTVNEDIKAKVYDFMPDFSINLSKAFLGANSNSDLIAYDESDVVIAEKEMVKYAEQLRSISSADELSEYLSSYDNVVFSFSEISDTVFKNDVGITKMAHYKDGVKEFLCARAMEKIPRYEYLYSKGSDDNGQYTKQTLNVKTENGETQTVEYIRYGGGEIYLPRFLAMYNAYQARETILTESDSENADEINDQIAQAIGGIPESTDEADSYFEDILNGTIDGKSSIKLDAFQRANIKSLYAQSILNGDMGISIEQTDNKLTVTLKASSEKIWIDIFNLNEEFDDYINETQTAIEAVLTQAKIPVTQWAISPGNATEALFVYFEGFFGLPVNSSELAADRNGILTEYGEMSVIHQNDTPEMGITLALTKGKTPVSIKLPDSPKCVVEALVYDVRDMDRESHPGEESTTSRAVTIAYIIDTIRFENEYGFPFPSINGVKPEETVTLFVEFTCLDSLNISEANIGTSIYHMLNSDFAIGYSYNGDVPHLGVRVSYSNETVTALPDGIYTYESSSAKETSVSVNPRLWFRGLHSGISNTLLNTLTASKT